MLILLSVCFFLFGLALGSFFNVVILRLVQEKNILGRSRCPQCSRQLAWYDNLPLLSFILLKGKCRYCGERISWQYPLVELAAGVLWLTGWLVFGELVSAIIFGVFASYLLILFVFDLRWYILPDVITLSGLVVAVVLNLALGKNWQWLVGAALLGALWFGVQYAVSRGRWVGSGDIRLGAMLGAMLASWQGLVTALILAYLGGSVVAVALLLLKKKGWKSQLPFGTFLTAAAVVTLLWGAEIWDWYLGLLW